MTRAGGAAVLADTPAFDFSNPTDGNVPENLMLAIIASVLRSGQKATFEHSEGC